MKIYKIDVAKNTIMHYNHHKTFARPKGKSFVRQKRGILKRRPEILREILYPAHSELAHTDLRRRRRAVHHDAKIRTDDEL